MSGGIICIGNCVRIGNDARLSCYLHEKEIPQIIINDGCYIGSHFSIITASKISIGKSVLIASYVSIMGHSHGIDPESTNSYGGQKLIPKSVHIDDGVWIGEHVLILPGVSIGKKSIIGAGSVVTKDIPEYCIAVGNPAKIIKRYDFNKHVWERVTE